MFLCKPHSSRSHDAVIAVVSLGLISFLSACGGGGSGSSSASSNLNTTPVALTASNYQTAASEMTSSAAYLGNSTNLATGVESTSADITQLVAFSRSQLTLLRLTPLAELPVGVTSTQILQCTSGNMTITYTVAGSSLAVGDNASFTLNNCYLEQDKATYTGAFSMTVTQLTGDYQNTNAYSIGLKLTYNNFSLATTTARIVGNGVIDLTEVSTAVYATTKTLSTTNFRSSATYGSTTYDRQLTNYQITEVTSPNAPTSTFKVTSSISGTVSSTALGGNAITVSTVVPLVRLNSATYPYTGQLVGTGSAGSKIRVTAQDSSNVLIELDANGDGTYETSTVKTWASL